MFDILNYTYTHTAANAIVLPWQSSILTCSLDSEPRTYKPLETAFNQLAAAPLKSSGIILKTLPPLPPSFDRSFIFPKTVTGPNTLSSHALPLKQNIRITQITTHNTHMEVLIHYIYLNSGKHNYTKLLMGL